MYIDLTTTVSPDSPLLQWAKAQDNLHIASGHVGTHLDTYENRPIPLAYFKSNAIVFDIRGSAEAALSQIPVQRFVLYTMWLDDPQMTGLRCRVIAECPEHSA